MTRGEEGPERTQRTVAELLAKYGNSSEEAAPRRRRRRADDAEETAPQAIIERVLSDSGNLPRLPAEEPPLADHRQAPASRHRPAPAPQQSSAQLPKPGQQSSAQLPKPQPAAPPPPPQAQPTQRQMPPVAPPPPQADRRPPTEQRRLPQNSQSMPRPKPQPQPSAQWPTPPPGAAPPTAEAGGLAARLDGRQDSRSDMRLPAVDPQQQQPQRMPIEGVTEQMPRIPDELPPGTHTGQHPAPHRVARTQRSMPMPQPPFPQHEPDEQDNYPTEFHGFEPVGAGGEATQYVEGIERDEDEYDSRPSMPSIELDRPVGEDDFDEVDEPEDEEKSGSPVKEWLSMAGQLAIGVIGGAALWLGFNWLWGQLPAAALIVALVVIVGLVWVVRKIRRADDLQTTILTVLVGLVVTVSPAAMLLLAR